jgi:predicted Zn-dependent protease
MTIHTLPTSGTAVIVHPARCAALVVALALAGSSAAAQSRSTIRSADLLAMDPLALARLLDESRPAPVSAAVRAHVLAGLPKKGEVQTFDDGERRKLAALAPVLEAAQRRSVYAIMVIDVPQAFVGLHARTVVFISRPVLGLMSEDELRAVVAHETGHEYIHAEYERATAEGHSGRLQDLELVCDIVAVMTLRAIGQEAWSLVAGIEKLLRFNRFHFGSEFDNPEYPSPLLRRSVVLALEKRILRVAGRR